MTRRELLLAQVAEEAGEIAQMAVKCLRFGEGEVYADRSANPGLLSNRERLISELSDLMGVVELLKIPFGLEEQATAKKFKTERMLGYSQNLGILEEEL